MLLEEVDSLAAGGERLAAKRKRRERVQYALR